MDIPSDPVAGSAQRPVPVPAPNHLPRLPRVSYQGHAAVRWTFTLTARAPILACTAFYQAWQLTLLHACARYHLVAPLHVLMPDHAHLLLLGTHAESDQWLALNFLRRHTRAALGPHDWQKQTHDHVLRESKRSRDAFPALAHYIQQNPVRAGLVTDWRDYPWLACSVPGYPELDPRVPDYWERFWRCHHHLIHP